MSEMQRVLGDAGPGWPLKALGREYRLGAATQRLKAEFEQWLKQRAVEESAALRGTLDPALFRELMAGVREDIAACKFSWRGPVFMSALGGGDGCVKLLHLLLQRHHPGSDEAEAERILESDPMGTAELMKEIIEAGPNFQPPATPGEKD